MNPTGGHGEPRHTVHCANPARQAGVTISCLPTPLKNIHGMDCLRALRVIAERERRHSIQHHTYSPASIPQGTTIGSRTCVCVLRCTAPHLEHALCCEKLLSNNSS
jgi:hypothetical protein